MSRITNDTSAIEQAFSFALVNVFSGILLLVWTAYNMITASLPFALLSLVVAPLMFIATSYFSATGAQSLPKIARRDRQCQRRIAGIDLGRARSAGIQPRR
jgi:ABC-type multidrug transport system fused ATPase/permease subunit